MNNDINLIGKKEIVKEKQNVFLVIAVGIFSVVFVVAIFVLVYSFLQKSRVSNLNTTVNNLKTKMSLVSSEKDKMLTVSNRLATIKSIIANRRSLDNKMQTIVSSIPTSFSVTDFSASDPEVSVTLSSESLADFDNLLKDVIPSLTQNKELAINHVDIGSFTENRDNYSLLVTFYFTAPKK